MSDPFRSSDSRAATSRQVIGGKSNSRLDIDVSGLPDNMEPTWIRETIAGAPDDDNMDLALGRNGYVPVTTDMLPQLKIPTRRCH
jgi:hypothetical protein